MPAQRPGSLITCRAITGSSNGSRPAVQEGASVHVKLINNVKYVTLEQVCCWCEGVVVEDWMLGGSITPRTSHLSSAMKHPIIRHVPWWMRSVQHVSVRQLAFKTSSTCSQPCSTMRMLIVNALIGSCGGHSKIRSPRTRYTVLMGVVS